MTKIKNRNKQMNDSLSIIIILLTIAGLSWLSYTIVDQKIVRDAMESGG